MPLPHEVLECLISSQHLRLRDLLNLRATCKQLKHRLTGALPPYLDFDVVTDDPQTAPTVLKVAGPHVRRLLAPIGFAPSLPCFYRLERVVIYIRPDLPLLEVVDLSPLKALPQLRYLGANSWQGEAAQMQGVSELQHLHSLHLENMYPKGGLPPGLTSLRLMAHQNPGMVAPHRGIARLRISYPLSIRAKIRACTSKLDHAALHMALFRHDPSQLSTIPCMQQVGSLYLHFSNDMQIHPYTTCPSTWLSGLNQLRAVTISLINKTNFAPDWDLSSCPKLSSFILVVQYGRVWPLSGIINVSATTFQLHAVGPPLNHGSCTLDCSSWAVQLADVCYNMDWSDVPGSIPTYIAELLGILRNTRGGPPQLLVNGMSEEAATAAAAARPASTNTSLLPVRTVRDLV